MAEPAFSDERVERRLAAILAADVVGYSRLMGEDEAGTLRRLKIHRLELIDPLIAQHKGRIVKLMGDGALVEFGSVVEAVACAVAIQRGMAERETELPEAQKIRFRIGVNTGDVIIEGDDIYGDGVNIAARLEGLAEPGGICVAESVFQQVKGKLPAGFTSLGAQKVKNIAEPVQAFKVDLGGTFKAVPAAAKRSWVPKALAAIAVLLLAGGAGWWWLSRTASPPAISTADLKAEMARKPGIAVLALDNLSGDERLGRIADGMIEDVITDLSRFRDLKVIARNSTFRYKGKAQDIREIGQELGANYVVEGSIQTDGEQVRLTTQLIDATNGAHVWSSRYEQPMASVLKLRNDLTAGLAGTLAAQGAVIAMSEVESIRRKPTTSLEAYDYLLLGQEAWFKFSRVENRKAFDYLKKAIELDPQLASAWRFLGWAHDQAAFGGYVDDPSIELAHMREACRTATALDPQDAANHFCVGYYHLDIGEFELAREKFEAALKLNPNHPNLLAGMSVGYAIMGEAERGVSMIERAFELNPFPTTVYFRSGAGTFFYSGNYARCVELRRNVARDDNPGDQRSLARCYAMQDQAEKAREHATRALLAQPQHSLEWEAGRPLGSPPPPRARERSLLLESFRKAGLPVCATAAQLAEFRAKWPDFKTMAECDAERAKAKG